MNKTGKYNPKIKKIQSVTQYPTRRFDVLQQIFEHFVCPDEKHIIPLFSLFLNKDFLIKKLKRLCVVLFHIDVTKVISK
jgi:hypothetical protein